MARLAALWGVLLLTASVAAAQGRAAASRAKLIAHGKYLVTRVAGCADCHSPHNEKGEEIQGRELQGSLLDFQPLHPVPGWVAVAPPIAGLEGWAESEAIHFLMTGLDRSNKHAGPPMPPYHLSRRDAEAVVAYLKSLPAV
ncbi:MAG TPA: c-type cytochrome, partial [Terriglobia bacterium]|nr:c-type cytochrome [Terriglobia bacterium]